MEHLDPEPKSMLLTLYPHLSLIFLNIWSLTTLHYNKKKSTNCSIIASREHPLMLNWECNNHNTLLETLKALDLKEDLFHWLMLL
jgi:hypothetical protein